MSSTLPSALNSALRGDNCPAEGLAPGDPRDLMLTISLLHNGTLQRNLRGPRTLNLHLSSPVAWALTSALKGDHETGDASALVTSLDRILTLAKALSPWGPKTNV